MIGRLLAVTAVLAVSTLSAAADTIPKLNVEPSCRAAARMGDSMDAKLQDCMREEQTARARLENDWTQFSSRSRTLCVSIATQTRMESYVEVLTCLQSAREAEKLREANDKRGN